MTQLAMLEPTLTTLRLFLHVLAASVWVGGQIVLAGIVPNLRKEFPTATKVVAQAFARVAWPAFAIVVLTGLWGLAETDVANTTTDYQATLLLKIALAMLSGAAAAVHQVGHTKVALALGGALGLLAAVAAMYLGSVLSTSG